MRREVIGKMLSLITFKLFSHNSYKDLIWGAER